jgi:membrane associated rhomboid family serine protease
MPFGDYNRNVTAEVPTEAAVRVSPSRAQAEAWDFVLEAVGIAHRVGITEEGWAVLVPPPLVATALAALDAADREASEEPAREPQAPDHGRSFVGLAAAATIAAFFWVSGPRHGADAGGWFRVGSGVAGAIVHGQWWRVVTALTLHSDFIHVTGNAVAFLVFLSALGRWLGGGLALFATLLAGAAGNLLTAYVYGNPHNVVGASTATFAALGLLGGLQFQRRYSVRTVGRFKRAFLLGVAASLGLFAMLGVGERVDMLAHASGLVFGLGFGLLWGHLVRRPVKLLGQAICLCATVATVAAAWLQAFRH